LLLLLKSTEGTSQYAPTIEGPSKELIQIRKIYEEGKLDTYNFLILLDSITHLTKDRADYEFYYSSFELAQYKFRNKIDTADRMAVEVPMHRLRQYPFYHVSTGEYFYKLRNLHIFASHLLIKYYVSKNDLLSLLKLEVYPTFFSTVYPPLKNAIEQLGGVWDRGEIPPMQISPPIKKN